MIIILSSFLFALFLSIHAYDPPEQIHIAVGETPDIIRFSWVTFASRGSVGKDDQVRYGDTGSLPSQLTMTAMSVVNTFTDLSSEHIVRYIHVATANGLKASTRYWYQVGNDEMGWSDIYNFMTPPNSATLTKSFPLKIIMYADSGDENQQAGPLVTEEVLNQNVDMILHAGDFAYNMYEENGTRGDDYMNDIQVAATHTLYMSGGPGNHEYHYNFSHYTERFQGQPLNEMVPFVWTSAGKLPNNWFFSWNFGNVHFISLSSEIYTDFPYLAGDQYNWLVSDLKIANLNRTDAPWIILSLHKPLYCSGTGYCTGSNADKIRDGLDNGNGTKVYGLDDVCYEYGVDFVIDGHVHNYERLWPIYQGKALSYSTVNMPATTTLTTGAAGNREGVTQFDDKQPEWSAVRSNDYSYSRFYVYNDTHVHWQQIATKDGSVFDDVWFVQEKHGPFGVNYPRDSLDRRWDSKPIGKPIEIDRVWVDENGNPVPVYDSMPKKWEKNIKYLGDDKELYRGVPGVFF